VSLIFAEPSLRILLLFLVVTALFLAHEPLARLARLRPVHSDQNRRDYWLKWLLIYGIVAVAMGVTLVGIYRLWGLLPMGLAVSLLLLIHIWLIGRRQERQLWGELLGVIGLTSSVPVTYYALSGQINEEALLLWLLNILYFTSAIFYVKMTVSRHVRSRQREAKRRTRQNILYHTFLVIAVLLLVWFGKVPGWTLLAYLPIVTRAFLGIAMRSPRLNLKRVGYTEVIYTLIFVGVTVLTWSA
jgi:hypothetical protein